MYLAIAGNIGVGKSSLTRMLAQRYALEPVYEAVEENPYLEDFYRDMRRYAFHSQMFFLAKRLEQHLKLVNPANRIIQDRTIYEDAAIFARNLFDEGVMEPRDYQSYCQMYSAIAQALRPPDLLIYLRASVPMLKARIQQRDRSYEADIEEGYLAKLNTLYDRWVAGYDLSDKLVVETDGLDFVHTQGDLERVLRLLETRGLSAPILP